MGTVKALVNVMLDAGGKISFDYKMLITVLSTQWGLVDNSQNDHSHNEQWLSGHTCDEEWLKSCIKFGIFIMKPENFNQLFAESLAVAGSGAKEFRQEMYKEIFNLIILLYSDGGLVNACNKVINDVGVMRVSHIPPKEDVELKVASIAMNREAKASLLEKHAKDFVPVFAAFYEDSLQTAEVEERESIQQLIITCLHHLKCYVQSESFQQLDKFRSRLQQHHNKALESSQASVVADVSLVSNVTDTAAYAKNFHNVKCALESNNFKLASLYLQMTCGDAFLLGQGYKEYIDLLKYVVTKLYGFSQQEMIATPLWNFFKNIFLPISVDAFWFLGKDRAISCVLVLGDVFSMARSNQDLRFSKLLQSSYCEKFLDSCLGDAVATLRSGALTSASGGSALASGEQAEIYKTFRYMNDIIALYPQENAVLFQTLDGEPSSVIALLHENGILKQSADDVLPNSHYVMQMCFLYIAFLAKGISESTSGVSHERQSLDDYVCLSQMTSFALDYWLRCSNENKQQLFTMMSAMLSLCFGDNSNLGVTSKCLVLDFFFKFAADIEDDLMALLMRANNADVIHSVGLLLDFVLVSCNHGYNYGNSRDWLTALEKLSCLRASTDAGYDYMSKIIRGFMRESNIRLLFGAMKMKKRNNGFFTVGFNNILNDTLFDESYQNKLSYDNGQSWCDNNLMHLFIWLSIEKVLNTQHVVAQAKVYLRDFISTIMEHRQGLQHLTLVCQLIDTHLQHINNIEDYRSAKSLSDGGSLFIHIMDEYGVSEIFQQVQGLSKKVRNGYCFNYADTITPPKKKARLDESNLANAESSYESVPLVH